MTARLATARASDDGTRVSRAVACEIARAADGGAADWLQLIPAGELDARDGRHWTHDDPQGVLAATRERFAGVDLVIDYEHQTDHAENNGQPAPAAGWIRELEARAGALWGRVEWTPRAAAAIKGREYRYISPTFAYDRNTMQVRTLHRAALTNSPAFDMPALARDGGGNPVTPEQLAALAAALGLAATAKPDELIAKAKALVAGALAPVAEALGLAKTATPDEIIAKAKAAAADTLAPVAEALGLAKTATSDEILAKAKATAPDPGQYVPRAEFDRIAVRLNTLETERTSQTATAAVDEAVGAGKIAPAQRDWALGLRQVQRRRVRGLRQGCAGHRRPVAHHGSDVRRRSGRGAHRRRARDLQGARNHRQSVQGEPCRALREGGPMTALAANRIAPTRPGRRVKARVTASATIYVGALLEIAASGYVTPATKAANKKYWGIAPRGHQDQCQRVRRHRGRARRDGPSRGRRHPRHRRREARSAQRLRLRHRRPDGQHGERRRHVLRHHHRLRRRRRLGQAHGVGEPHESSIPET